jgi:MFS family permease
MLYITKILRMFSFGAISVVFFAALQQKGIAEKQIGFLQSLITAGDIIISLIITTRADQIGRKTTLIISAILKIFTGFVYAISDNYILLIISGALGVLTVSGGEIGPFLPIEQAAIAQIIEENSESTENVKQKVAMAYGYYNMASYLSQAAGNLFTGVYISGMRQKFGGEINEYYVHIIYMYAVFGLLMLLCYLTMSKKIEPNPSKVTQKALVNCAGLTKKSTKIIVMLSLLFFVDSFAGGFVAQSFLSFYYDKKYHFSMDKIGGLLFVCNIVGGISGVLSSKLVARIGAMATMIFTHLPSNVLLILVALTSNPTLAVLFIMGRFCISQMDVPARQTYVSMVVSAE